MTRKSVLAAALAFGLGSTAAHADGFSFGGLFASPSPSAKVRQAAHNRYAPYDGVEDVQSSHAYSSGYYTSKAKSEGVRSRYAE